MFNPNEHMMTLQGRQYLQVMWRLVWFREEHPNWRITTQMVSHNEEEHTAVFAALISDETGAGLAMGHGSESARDFRDYLEKAETKAIGRALAILGYGTQFAPELDEAERIVDSPVERKQKAKPKQESSFERELIEADVNIPALLAKYHVVAVDDLTDEMVKSIRAKLREARKKEETNE